MDIYWFASLAILLRGAHTAQTLPPLNTGESLTLDGSISIDDLSRVVYLDSSFADTRDTEGLTLIPPSAAEFAQTFIDDLNELFPDEDEWALQVTDNAPTTGASIVLGASVGDVGLTYENGRTTEEGYSLRVSSDGIVINGTGARGMFWGTRSILQQMLLGETLVYSETRNAPAYVTRGYMLDAGRKWYAPSMLKELCTYASFFQMSEFHYHSSDNYPLSRGQNETWQDVYSHFSLWPETAELQQIVENRNESLSRADFEDLQSHCAQRGVTVIPEIEAPGHCLAITKWKPELALAKKDLLNLTHPDSIPTIKSVWADFLPWFQTKEVHIGADEYDSELADDYINFVNEMSDFVKDTSGKRIRIWGTYEPSKNFTISKDIIVQHWQYGQSDPVQLDRDGYDLINSQDWWAYMTLKNDHTPILPAPYPQFYNTTRTLNFANVPGWQWQPSYFNQVNTSQQLAPTSARNKGAILAAWNDNGPDPTTQLEAYYAMREGLPLVAARAWSGSRGPQLDTSTLAQTLGVLTARAPGQNLDRRITGSSNSRGMDGNSCSNRTIWIRPTSQASSDDAATSSPFGANISSIGPPYTLTFTATSPFTLSSSLDATSFSLLPNGTLLYTADTFTYPLRSINPTDGYDPGHPGRIWINQTTSSHDPVSIQLPAEIRMETDVIGGSRVWVNNTFQGRFEAFVYGGRNTQFSWSQMAFVAPVEEVRGGVERMSVVQCVNGRGLGGMGEEGMTPGPGQYTSVGSRHTTIPSSVSWSLVVAVIAVILL